MGSFKRLLLWISLIIGGLGFLTFQGSLTPLWQGLYAAGLLGILATLLFSGGADMPAPPRPGRMQVAKVAASESEADDLPAPVTEDESAGGERAAKLARSRGIDVQGGGQEIIVESAEEVVEVEPDPVHEAEEYVVEVDAESMLSAEIDRIVEERREQHGEIRNKIERRRRTQMARIRADTAKVFASFEGHEDIQSLLNQPDHGLTVLDEPLDKSPGKLYGSLLIRLDEKRILKLRVPLDEGFRAAKEIVENSSNDALPPPPDGLSLPPPPGDLPLPLPPSLDALPPPPGGVGELPAPPSATAGLPPPPGAGGLPPPPRLKNN
jgi:hypothetical protein